MHKLYLLYANLGEAHEFEVSRTDRNPANWLTTSLSAADMFSR